jgi:hypothetical protein
MPNYFPGATGATWIVGDPIGFGTNAPPIKQNGANYGAVVTIGENNAGGSLAVGYNNPPPHISASLMVRKDLRVDGVSMSGDALTVTGGATISKSLAISGTGAESGNALTVTGAAAITKHLLINGTGGNPFALTVIGATALSGTALIDKSLTINGSGNPVNALTVTGAANVSGTATIGERLIINGATTGGTVTGTTLTVGDTVSGTAAIGKSLSIGGPEIGGVLTVNGTASIGSAASNVSILKGTPERTPLLDVHHGFIAQSSEGTYGDGVGKYLGLGALPQLNEPLGSFLPQLNNYGLRMSWGAYFGLFQLTDLVVKKTQKDWAKLRRRDLVIGWGGDTPATQAPQLRLRFIGRRGKKQKAAKIYDVVLVNPKGKLTVKGGVSLSWLAYSSDARMKSDVAPIEGALDKVMAMRGVSFLWKRAEFPKENLEKGPQIGFVAQEVEEVCPELVSTGDKGIKGIDYSRMTPVLVEAMKEQQRVISDQQTTINEQKARLDALESALKKLGAIS